VPELFRRLANIDKPMLRGGQHFLRDDLPEATELQVPVREQFGRKNRSGLRTMLLD
jgi:hypothetical protein